MLSRGQIVGLTLIMFIVIALGLVFNLIIQKQREKIDYLEYDKDKNNILLKGDFIKYVNLNDTYIEEGIYGNEKPIITYFKSDRGVASIDTSHFGTYEVRYYLKNGKYASRIVIILDTESPKIIVPEKQTISLDEVSDFDLEKGVVCTDNSKDVTLSYEGKLEKKKGSYIIVYTATDSSNNKTVKKRLIKVN